MKDDKTPTERKVQVQNLRPIVKVIAIIALVALVALPNLLFRSSSTDDKSKTADSEQPTARSTLLTDNRTDQQQPTTEELLAELREAREAEQRKIQQDEPPVLEYPWTPPQRPPAAPPPVQVKEEYSGAKKMVGATPPAPHTYTWNLPVTPMPALVERTVTTPGALVTLILERDLIAYGSASTQTVTVTRGSRIFATLQAAQKGDRSAFIEPTTIVLPTGDVYYFQANAVNTTGDPALPARITTHSGRALLAVLTTTLAGAGAQAATAPSTGVGLYTTSPDQRAIEGGTEAARDVLDQWAADVLKRPPTVTLERGLRVLIEPQPHTFLTTEKQTDDRLGNENH